MPCAGWPPGFAVGRLCGPAIPPAAGAGQMASAGLEVICKAEKENMPRETRV